LFAVQTEPIRLSSKLFVEETKIPKDHRKDDKNRKKLKKSMMHKFF
jgi:hypothetical protein